MVEADKKITLTRDRNVLQAEDGVTHATELRASRTFCDIPINEIQGLVAYFHYTPTCPVCAVYTAYLKAGFKHQSTGGGCDAFFAPDPHWAAPDKIIHLKVDTFARRLPVRITALSTDIIAITWNQMEELHERITKILEAHPAPYVMVTDESNAPETMDSPVTVSYYNGGSSEWEFGFELPDSAAVIRAYAAVKTGDSWRAALEREGTVIALH